jgi:superfamily II DNA/RNA helicase
MKSIEKMGFEEASPIQAQTIPLALEGKDILVKRKQEQVKQQHSVFH